MCRGGGLRPGLSALLSPILVFMNDNELYLSGPQIKTLRTGRGWSQEKLAWLAGCSSSRLRQLEKGMDADVESEARNRIARTLLAPGGAGDSAEAA